MIEGQDWEFESTEESSDEEADVIPYRISYYPSDLTLQVYLQKYEQKNLVIPEFQRNFVWNQIQASKLIESFLLGLPVPGVFLYKETDTNKLLIIDGQQRILTIIRFFQGQFENKVFVLKKVSPRWEGKGFRDLSEPDRLFLQDSVLRATVIQQLQPDDNSSVYHIFERLNTGGVKLNPMEIRKCIFAGPYFGELETANQNLAWRLLLGKPTPDKRLRDVELILRVLALYESEQTYEKPMKRFLNAHASRHSKSQDTRYINLFTKAVEHILQTSGERPFHLRGRLNYAALDSILVAVMRVFEKGLAPRASLLADLKADEEFMKSVSMSTSDESVLKNRLTLALQHATSS